MTPRILTTAVLAASFVTGGAFAAELRMLSSWPENHVFTREVGTAYIEMVQAASDGAITIDLSGPDAVPSFEQFEPTASGLFDVLVTHPVYHYGVTGVGTAIDATEGDPGKRREAGLFDFIDRYYNTLGLKLLSAPMLGSIGFQYVLREPITDAPAFAGRKIRGTPSYHPMIRALEGTPTNIPPAEVYSALEKSVVDGAAWGMVGVKDLKFNEVAGYLAAPGFGTVGLMVFMNLDAWNGLSAAEQELLAEQGRLLEDASKASFDLIAAEERLWLLSNGMKLTLFKPDDARRLSDLMNEGVWEIAMNKSPEIVAEMRKLAREAGLSN